MAKKESTKTTTKKKAPVKKSTKKVTKKVTKKTATKPVEKVAKEPVVQSVADEPVVQPVAEEPVVQPVAEEPKQEVYTSPRRSIAFIGSECYPFVKTGGLGDVMYALPKALVKQNCDVKVILPRYKCIPWEYQEKMIYKGAFEMNLCEDGRSY